MNLIPAATALYRISRANAGSSPNLTTIFTSLSPLFGATNIILQVPINITSHIDVLIMWSSHVTGTSPAKVCVAAVEDVPGR